MTPIDPAKTASEDPRPPMAPPYVDDDPNLESVRQGMNVAETEKRQLVADDYESIARGREDSAEALDDIDRALDEGGNVAPELGAMHTTGRAGER